MQPKQPQFNTHTHTDFVLFLARKKKERMTFKHKKEMHCNKMNSNTGRTQHTTTTTKKKSEY